MNTEVTAYLLALVLNLCRACVCVCGGGGGGGGVVGSGGQAPDILNVKKK